MKVFSVPALLCGLVLFGCNRGAENKPDPEPEEVVFRSVSFDDRETFPNPPEELDKKRAAVGWVKLFDGQTLFGWETIGNTKATVAEGKILFDPGTGGELKYFVPIADAEIRLRYRVDALSSGENASYIDLREVAGGQPGGVIIPLNGDRLGGTGDTDPDTAPPANNSGERELIIRWLDSDLTITVDGTETFFANTFPPGDPVPLSIHCGDDTPRFSVIEMRPLGFGSLMPPQDLDGWTETPNSQGTFERDGDTIHVTEGRGYLQKDVPHADFALKFQARTNSPGLNGGVFFRNQPGTDNGYEFQIEFQTVQGDRSVPYDFGTGGIYRRQPARWIVGDDEQWVTGVLLAVGRRFASFVNGVPVMIWEDDRDPNDNPRAGYRAKAGVISLQAHDPTTDLNLRDIAVAPW